MKESYSAWNPGLESDIPPAFRSLETIHRPENVSSTLENVDEISKQTGIGQQALVAFRPERLVLHELIIRVTADIQVLEGRDEIELGRNFRMIARTILQRHIQPHMAELVREFAQLRERIHARVEQVIVDTLFPAPKPAAQQRRWFAPFRRPRSRPATPPQEDSILERESRAIATIKERGLAAGDPLESAVYRELYHLLAAIAGHRGYLGPDREFLIRLACDRICNAYGSTYLGAKISPLIDQAVAAEGYSKISGTEAPLLISLKGASAAGKSSLRPMLQQMMGSCGIQPGGYAVISPDVWRRLLLDYDSLGSAYKYAGRLTSHEVIAIDGKLDRYLRDKADRMGALPNLLVDRFRFDSFSTERISRILHGTYLRHVHTLAMYFVVTPPHATVQRGWERGLQTGRYKAVEDFLDHSVEAYTGMPRILFKWLAYDRPLFRYEFLDNDVPKGTYPKTIAFGDQKEMSILNCSAFIDILRYQKINIRARRAEDVYPDGAGQEVENNIGFLQQCVRRIPRINFLDPESGNPYLIARQGQFTLVDQGIFDGLMREEEQARIFMTLAPHLMTDADPEGRLRAPENAGSS